MVERELRTLYDDDRLEIGHIPGSSGHCVISFTGVGLGLGGLQIDEFSASLAGLPSDILHVKDKTRHWYGEVFDEAVERLNASLRARGIVHATCLGNSMGGFGALYFAPHLHNCRLAIAFAPQSSVNSAVVPWEPRWTQWRDGIPPGEGLDLRGRLDPRIAYRIFFGSGSWRDARHVERILDGAPPTAAAFGFPEAGHGVAKYLKKQGVLRRLVEDLLLDREELALGRLNPLPHQRLGPLVSAYRAALKEAPDIL